MLDVTMPGVVYDDYLDPQASDMQDALGLPEPVITKAGLGKRVRYERLADDTARELADYLSDRADLLRANDDTERGHAHRQALKVAEQIRYGGPACVVSR